MSGVPILKEEDLLKHFEEIQETLEELQKEYLGVKDQKEVYHNKWGFPVIGSPIFIYEIHSST